MRSFLLILAFFLSVVASAHQTVTGRVVDAETGEPLSYVSIYVSDEKGTLSNDEGDFSIDVLPEETLRFSCVGYEVQRMRASDVKAKVRLKPLVRKLREVTVKPVPVNDVLDELIRQLKEEFRTKSYEEAQYFNRTLFIDDENAELLEAFMEGNSALNLRYPKVISGIKGYEGEGAGETRTKGTNVHRVLQLGPMIKEVLYWNSTIVPLNDFHRFKSYYDITSCELTGDDGQRIYQIDLKYNGSIPSSQGEKTVLEGSLYIDAQTNHLLSFDCNIRNITMNVGGERYDSEVKVNVEYRHTKGFTEVYRVAARGGNQRLKFRSLLFNIDGLQKVDKVIQTGTNLISAIEHAGYDSKLWDQYDIVKRTGEEEQVAFGVVKADSMQNSRLTLNRAIRQSGPFRPLVERLADFGRNIPQEKVFVHTDNTTYFLGDTIWFSAYTRQTNTGRPSKMSGVLYVELYSNDGYLVERKLVEMQEGRGNGFFALDKDIMYSGFYELRAYTRWQLNWGLFEHKHSLAASNWFHNPTFEQDFYKDYDKLYSRVFPVYDKPEDKANPSRNMTSRVMRRYFKKDMDEAARKLTLSLFPEGGNLVAGVENRVAFEAAWNDGEQLEGVLSVDGKNIPVVNRGRGLFTITPEKGMEREVIFTTKDGQRVKAKLPKPEAQGVAVQVRQEGEDIIITANLAGLNPDSLALTVLHEGKVEDFKTLSTPSPDPSPGEGADTNPTQKVIQITPLPREGNGGGVGIHQLTIFDTQGRVWADRLFFVTKQDMAQPTLAVSGLKDEYQPYEKIEMAVEVPSSSNPLLTSPFQGAETGSGTLPLEKGELEGDIKRNFSPSFISLAVRDGYQADALFDNGNIMTEMLLASEIKGFIPNPGWYFEKDDEEHRQALDLLMMTQGWRRFVWKDMAVKGEWDITQPNEQTPIITGDVWPNKVREVEFTQIPEDGGDDIVNPGYIVKNRVGDGVTVHAELIHPGYKRGKAVETMTKQGQFGIQLPHYYGHAVFFLAASDVSKWKKGKKYKWVKMQSDKAEEEFMRNLKATPGLSANGLQNKMMKFPFEVRSYLDPPELFVRVTFPYPRFVKPYSYYQSHLDESVDDSLGLQAEVLADGTHQMREVKIHSRFGGMRRFDDSQPAFIIDAEEAQNMAEDAGIRLYMPNGRINSTIVRTLMGDYGMESPYVHFDGTTNPDGRLDNIFYTYGMTKLQRLVKNLNIPKDSVYTSKYLKSTGMGYRPQMSDIADLLPSYIENLVIYSDYCPRQEGDRRYWGGNMPETRVVSYPYYDNDRRVQYRDRRYILPGFSYPAEFYSPDYSKQTPPEPTDYRRTLYWNPNLKLDEDGKAQITLYNNSRTTKVTVEAEGQTASGGLLWSGKE